MDASHWFTTWVLIFTVPKLLVIPLVKWMWDAMKASDRQDEADALWLAERERARGDDGGGSHVHRPVRPRPERPWRPRRPGGTGPVRHARRGQAVVRHGARVPS